MNSTQILTELTVQSSSHPEVLKQALPIFIFGAKNKLLTPNHLTSLWEMSLGKHESVKHTLYSSISQMASSFTSVELLDTLLTLISKLPTNEFDVETLNLLQVLTLIAKSFSNSHKQWFGLDVLWQVVKNTTTQPNVALKAKSLFVELLNKPEFQSRR